MKTTTLERVSEMCLWFKSLRWTNGSGYLVCSEDLSHVACARNDRKSRSGQLAGATGFETRYDAMVEL